MLANFRARKRLSLGIVAALVCAGAVLGITTSARSAHAVPAAQLKADDLGQQVLAEIGSSKLTSLSFANGSVTVTGDLSGGLEPIWLAKLAGSGYAEALRSSQVGTPAAVIYVDVSGQDIGNSLGSDPISSSAPAPATALPGGCGEAIDSSVQSSGAQLVDAKTIGVLGGACDITLKVATGPNGTDPGAIVGGIIAPINPDQSRPYFVTVEDATGSAVEMYAWVPGIGGDQGQGMGWSAPGWPSGSGGLG